MSPAAPPVVRRPRGVTAVLACHGGHVAIHALPDAGLCLRTSPRWGPRARNGA
jgi:hypothetical protein